MIRIFAVLILIFVGTPAIALDACSEDVKAQYKPLEQTYTNGLLFRISKCGSADSYMFGTYHSDNEMMWNNAQVAVAYLTTSSTAVFEVIDADPNTIQSAMYFPDDSKDNLQTLLGDHDFNSLYSKMVLVNPMPVEAVKRMRPWAAAILLQMPKQSSGKGILDDRLKEIAAGKKIRLAPLESLQEQFNVFTQLTLDEQVTMLRDSINGLDQLNQVSQQIDQAYVSQDLRVLGGLADASFRMMMDVNLKEKLIKNLITTRNENMLNRMIPYIDEGNAFIAVGALHLMGPTGVLTELEKQGYLITPIR